MKDDVDDDDASASSSTSVPETTVSYGNPRASRNMAEKHRRDSLNTNIVTMGELVPTVADSPRKMDKISIMRLAAAYLRVKYALGQGALEFLPRELGELDLEQFIIDNLIDSGGFFIVVTTTGKVVYVSQKIQDHLGHTQRDLLGHSLYNFVHPQDREELTKNLIPDEMQGMAVSSLPQIVDGANENSNSSADSASLRNERRPFREQRRSFELRMLHRTASRREHTQYECLEITGVLRLADACKCPELNATRMKHRGISTTSNDIIFVGLARLLTKRPITAISIMDANKNEYVTRHLVDGRIIYCDHRVSVVAGYLSEEVSGLSAFSFMHKDDFRWTMIALRQMYDRAETCGSSCYRLRSKTGEFIYLRTHGYLEFDKDTQTVESFVCINTLVPEEEGMQLVRQMKKRFSATVCETATVMIQSTDDALRELASESQPSNWKSNVEDPSKTQLEDAITHLVSDLSSSVSEERLAASPVRNEQYAKAVIVSQHLPPASAQASKIGIKKIDHYLVVQGKGNRTPKDESKTGSDGQQAYPSEKQEDTRPSGKSMPTNQTQDDGVQGAQDEAAVVDRVGGMMATNESSAELCMNVPRDPGTSRLDVSQGTNISNAAEEPVKCVSSSLCDSNPCEIKIEHCMDVFERERGKAMVDYLENNIADNSVSSDSEPCHQYSLKRMYSDEDIRATCNKKRHSNVPYATADASEEHQGVSYVDCRPSVNEEYPEFSTGFNQYSDMSCQPMKVAGSPSSTLNEVIVDYQQVESTVPLLLLNPGDEFIDLHDLKDDSLLSLGLDANPDTFNGRKIQELVNNAISNELTMKHLQLENSMGLQASEINVMTQCSMKNPALQAKRASLTSLQAEHNMQKQILETLQQDHRNIQISIKHNIDV
ncbi:uncharacterized protein LOC143369986 isoform X2 [Andrena cerasifolii]|uniref:uncharacterized protein LOC143369986 isoform X2 n=1 Tax=Andrena cerasifolii TaxID=2819439 RepID=UPI004037D6EE